MVTNGSVPTRDPVLSHDWQIVANASDLAENAVIGARVLETDLVLWRVNGVVHVAKNLCSHRGGSFYDLTGEGRYHAKVVEEKLQCPYHGWQYNTGGQCVYFPYSPSQTPPKTARLEVYHVQEAYDWIWVCLGEPAGDVPPFKEWDDPAFRTIGAGPYPLRATAQRFVENFLDVPHFPFVHEGYLGDLDHTEMRDYEVTTEADGIHARNILFWQPNPDGTGQGSDVTYNYQVIRPLTVRFTKHGQGNRQFSMFCHVTPNELKRSTVWMYMAMNYGFDTPAEEIVAFQDEVSYQDIPIVESQRPELLPLDLTAELSMRPDKVSIAYRMWLRELGVSFGTA